VEAERYLERARREGESARSARERSEAARRFALRQIDEGLREHFLRLAGRAEMEAVTHDARARRFEAIASTYGATPAAATRDERGSSRDSERPMSHAKIELVRQVLATCLRNDFDVAPEHLADRTSS
jgi:hypothetical protein